jgi:AAA15 family ATPase/GTPase
MKVKSLKIKNFKSFGSHANDVEDQIRQLSSFNMLYGYNNSGKSNILKFLNLVFQPKTANERIRVEGEKFDRQTVAPFWKGLIDDSGFLFHKNNRSKPIEFNFIIEISHDELRNNFQGFHDLEKDFLNGTHANATFDISGRIKAVDEFHTSEISLDQVKLNRKLIYSIDHKGNTSYFEKAKREDSPLINDGVAFANLLSVFNNLICFLDNNRFFSVERITHGETELNSSSFKNWLYNLYLDPKQYKIFSELTEFIKKNKVSIKNTDEGLFKDVEKNSPFGEFNPEFSKSGKDEIEIMLKSGKGRFPLTSFGTGIQQFLFILTKVFMTRSRIVLIEELEMNFSPKYQQELLEIIKKLISQGKIDQLFFTSIHEMISRFMR